MQRTITSVVFMKKIKNPKQKVNVIISNLEVSQIR